MRASRKAGKWKYQGTEAEIARAHLGVYVRRGVVKVETCEVCETIECIEAHHEDHSKPLKVRWLCRAHHALVTNNKLCLLRKNG